MSFDGPTTDQIAAMLEDRISEVVADLYPGAVVVGGIAYCSAKGGKDLGSFQVHLVTHGKFSRGQWNRWSERIGGGVLNLVCYALTGNHKGEDAYREAFKWARRFLGIDTARPETEWERKAREDRARRAREDWAEAEAEAAAKAAKRRSQAGGQWHDGGAISGTPAEKYLVNRGLPLDLIRSVCTPDVIRFNRSVHYDRPPFTDHPAMLGRVCGVDGAGTALGRVFLTEDGRKAELVDPKLTIGSLGGGAVRLGGMARKIGIAEGMETALGAMAINRGGLPVWATLGTSGMGAFEVPPGVDEVVIFADGDWERERNGRVITPGLDAARRLEARLMAAGVKVSIALPPRGKDWLDVWNEMRGLYDAA